MQSPSKVVRMQDQTKSPWVMKRQVLLTFLQAKRQEKIFIRPLLMLKIIKKCNNDAFLGESATRKLRLLLLVVRLQN